MALSINEESLRLFTLLGSIDKLRPFADTAMRLGLRPSTQVFLPLTESESLRSDVSYNVRAFCEWLEDVHVDDEWIVGVALATIAVRAPFLITKKPVEAAFTFARRRAELTGVRFASSSNPQYASISLDKSGGDDAECEVKNECDSAGDDCQEPEPAVPEEEHQANDGEHRNDEPQSGDSVEIKS